MVCIIIYKICAFNLSVTEYFMSEKRIIKDKNVFIKYIFNWIK